MNPHVQHALVLFEQHRFGEATMEIQHLLGENPHDATAHAMAGLCLYLQHRPADAVAHARESLRLAPDMAGYDTVTRVLSNHNPPRQAFQTGGHLRLGSHGLTSMRQQGLASGFNRALAPVHFLAPTAEIQSFLERWRHLLATSNPQLGTLTSSCHHADSEQRCAGRATAARKPLSLLSRIRHVENTRSGFRHSQSRPCDEPVDRL